MMETRLPGHYEWRLGAKSGLCRTVWRMGQIRPFATVRVRSTVICLFEYLFLSI